MSSLPDDLDRLMKQHLADAAADLAASCQAATDGMQAEIAYALPVRKLSAVMPISSEMAMEYGLIPDTRPPVVITRRDRLRWWRQAKVAAVRLGLGEWVAGQRFRDSEDY